MNVDAQSALRDILVIFTVATLVSAIGYSYWPDFAGPIAATLATVSMVALVKYRRLGWQNFGFTRRHSLPALVLRATLTLGGTLLFTLAVVLFLTEVLGLSVPSQTAETRFDGIEGNFRLFLFWAALGWLVGGFMEEAIFRGFLIQRFESLFQSTKLKTVLAVCGQALLFGAIHFVNRGLLKAAAMVATGLAMGIFYITWGRTLWPLVIAHGTLNTLGFLGDYLGAEDF